jgi:hypothetical protein
LRITVAAVTTVSSFASAVTVIVNV